MRATMTSGANPFSSDSAEYLDLQQAALICSVSDERFDKWLDKGKVPIIEVNGTKLIHAHDLIQHLVRHNIPIPDRLLQSNNKKVLFVLADEDLPQTVITELIWALYTLRQKTSYIFDLVHFDTTIELKIITFRPDIIIGLQGSGGDDGAALKILQKMAGNSIAVYTFTEDHPLDFDQVFSG
jgi:hypothetical protein